MPPLQVREWSSRHPTGRQSSSQSLDSSNPKTFAQES